VVIQDGIVYAIEGRGAGSIAIKAGGKDDVTKTNVIWSGRDSSRFGTPIVYDGRMYFVSDTVMNCISAATGEKIYQSRFEGGSAPAGGRGAGDGSGGGRGEGGGRPGGGRQGRGGGMGGNYASLILADGKLYYTTRNGDMLSSELQISLNNWP
jgi:outer membrane protein assembly factor BamB